MKASKFRLYWLRETFSDIGTPIRPEDLPQSIRGRILDLAGEAAAQEASEFAVRLPYLDRREQRRQNSVLTSLAYERTDHLIRAVLPPAAATRDMMATLALADPLWRSAPRERDFSYFYTWQRVAQALQHWLRDHVPLEYFRNVDILSDRRRAYPMIVYQACRIFPGRPRTDFTYDLGNYPWSNDTLVYSWRMSGSAIQRVMEGLKRRLHDAGRTSLACRYAPVLNHDVLLAVQRRPRAYASLLVREAAIINAVIDLGTRRDPQTIHRSAKLMNQALRNMHFQDLRRLGPDLLEEARRALALRPANYGVDGFDNGGDARIPQNANPLASRSPYERIGGQKDGDHRYSRGGRQMGDSGIVSDVDARTGQPAGQLV